VKEAKRLVAPLFKVHVTLSLTFGLKLTHHQAAMRHDTSHLMGNYGLTFNLFYLTFFHHQN
jgi:hypothetical protein